MSMDPRAKLVVTIVGVGLLIYGRIEWSLGRDATAEPVPVSLAELEQSPHVKNPHITVTDHIRLYSGCVYSFMQRKGATGSPGPKAQVNYAYYPIISMKHSDSVPANRDAPPPDRFSVLVKTKLFKTLGEIPDADVQSSALTGLVVNAIESLSAKEESLIRSRFPAIDFSKVLILEQDRKPMSQKESSAIMAAGCLLILLGLAWAFGGQLTSRHSETHCEHCGIEAPTRHVSLFQNIGALVMRYTKQYRGNLCKSCVHRFFWTYTPVTLFVGWWGVISMMITPLTLLNNIGTYFLCLPMPAVPMGAVKPVLDESAIQKLKPHTEQIFTALGGSQTLSEVATSTAMQTGVSAGQVILWIRAVMQAQSDKK